MGHQKSYQLKVSHWRELWRRFIYSPYLGEAIRTLLEHGDDRSAHRTPGYWNGKATEASAAEFSYLGGLAEIDVRDALTTSLARSFMPTPRAVLDVGCGGGSLAIEMARSGMKRYVGIDISEVAIDRATVTLQNELGPKGVRLSLTASDLTVFEPPDETDMFDVIVFNEVLYYLRVDVAVEQVMRYARWLQPQGLICVSMLSDPKSRSILRHLLMHTRWVCGFRYREEQPPGSCHWRGPSCPALTTALLRPSSDTSGTEGKNDDVR